MTDMEEQFSRITEDFEGSEFRALFRQAEQEIAQPEVSFTPADVGELAWSRLELHQYPEALRDLFHAYWRDDQGIQEEQEIHHAALNADASYLSDEALDGLKVSLACGPIEGTSYLDEIEFWWVSQIVSEVELLRRRLDLMRRLLVSTEEIKNVPKA